MASIRSLASPSVQSRALTGAEQLDLLVRELPSPRNLNRAVTHGLRHLADAPRSRAAPTLRMLAARIRRRDLNVIDDASAMSVKPPSSKARANASAISSSIGPGSMLCDMAHRSWLLSVRSPRLARTSVPFQANNVRRPEPPGLASPRLGRVCGPVLFGDRPLPKPFVFSFGCARSVAHRPRAYIPIS